MTVLGQAIWYWALAIVLILAVRAYILAMLHQRDYRDRLAERLARAPEDAYWHLNRAAESRRAFQFILDRHLDRLNDLLSENDERREQRLRVVR